MKRCLEYPYIIKIANSMCRVALFHPAQFACVHSTFDLGSYFLPELQRSTTQLRYVKHRFNRCYPIFVVLKRDWMVSSIQDRALSKACQIVDCEVVLQFAKLSRA